MNGGRGGAGNRPRTINARGTGQPRPPLRRQHPPFTITPPRQSLPLTITLPSQYPPLTTCTTPRTIGHTTTRNPTAYRRTAALPSLPSPHQYVASAKGTCTTPSRGLPLNRSAMLTLKSAKRCSKA